MEDWLEKSSECKAKSSISKKQLIAGEPNIKFKRLNVDSHVKRDTQSRIKGKILKKSNNDASKVKRSCEFLDEIDRHCRLKPTTSTYCSFERFKEKHILSSDNIFLRRKN